MAEPVIETVLRQWSRCGIRVGRAGSYVFPGPGRYPVMRRDHWLLAVVEHGALSIDHVRRRVPARAGQAYLTPPDIGLVEVVDEAAPACRRVVLDFSVFMAPGYANPLCDVDLPLVVDLPQAASLLPELLTCFSPSGYRPVDRRQQLRARGLADRLVLEYLLALYDQPAARVRRHTPTWLHDLDRILLQDLADPDWTVAGMAQGLGLSVSRLAHACSAHFGYGPKARLRELRLERAVYLLQNLRAPQISEVAKRCGYRSQSLFSRHFRQRFGCTPTAFAAGLPD